MSVGEYGLTVTRTGFHAGTQVFTLRAGRLLVVAARLHVETASEIVPAESGPPPPTVRGPGSSG